MVRLESLLTMRYIYKNIHLKYRQNDGRCSRMLEMAHPRLSRHNEAKIELIEKEKSLRSGKATTISESFD